MVAQRLDDTPRRVLIESLFRRDEDPPPALVIPPRRVRERLPFLDQPLPPLAPRVNLPALEMMRLNLETALRRLPVFEPLPLPPVLPTFTLPAIPERFEFLEAPALLRRAAPDPVRADPPPRDPVIEAPPVSPRAHLCRICNVDLANSGNEPIISHGGRRDQQHRVHRACMRRFYAENRSRECSVAGCGDLFWGDSFFSEAERKSLTRKFLFRGSVVSAGLGAGLTAGATSFLILAFKVLAVGMEALDRLNKNGRYSMVKSCLPCCLLLSSAAVFIGGVTALVVLASKVGSCFHKDRNPGEFGVEESAGNLRIALVAGFGLFQMFKLRNVWLLPVSFGLVSGVISGVCYAVKNIDVSFWQLEDLWNI